MVTITIKNFRKNSCVYSVWKVTLCWEVKAGIMKYMAPGLGWKAGMRFGVQNSRAGSMWTEDTRMASNFSHIWTYKTKYNWSVVLLSSELNI